MLISGMIEATFLQMSFSPDFIAAAAASDICASYYALCDEYPLRLNAPKASLTKNAILEAAAATSLSLEKLGGPGAVYRLSSLPDGLSLNFIVQGHGSLETDFTVQLADTAQRGTFATLCHSARISGGRPAHQPPYPRPTCLSADELVAAMKRLEDLTRMLGSLTGRP
jgi:hypothetical protein